MLNQGWDNHPFVNHEINTLNKSIVVKCRCGNPVNKDNREYHHMNDFKKLSSSLTYTLCWFPNVFGIA